MMDTNVTGHPMLNQYNLQIELLEITKLSRNLLLNFILLNILSHSIVVDF